MKQGYDVVVAGSGNAAFCAALAAPPTGDRELTNLFSEQSYPVGIVVNAEGRRFVDEGVDFRNYLLTGEYDHTCSAGETEETARAIRGVCRWCARTRLRATSS
jgi:hypothetical protein